MNSNPTKVAIVGSRQFQWELAGWFGAAFGSTAWFLYGSIALAWQGDAIHSAISALAWLVLVVLSAHLWARRDRVAPFTALVVFLITASFLMPIVWYVGWDSPTDDLLASLYWIRGVRNLAACLIFPSALIAFTFREYATPTDEAGRVDPTPDDNNPYLPPHAR